MNQLKSARTRINEDQLVVLRAHFDINNSPAEDQIREMSERTTLPPKVIKHWFRNTLFKERQRNKDSPYNFSIPPSTTLNMEDYEKNGRAAPKTSVAIKTESNESVVTSAFVPKSSERVHSNDMSKGFQQEYNNHIKTNAENSFLSNPASLSVTNNICMNTNAYAESTLSYGLESGNMFDGKTPGFDGRLLQTQHSIIVDMVVD